MSELGPEPHPRRQSGLLIAIGVVVIVAIAAGLEWMQSDRTGSSSTTAAASPTTVAQNSAPTVPSDEIAKSLDQLRQQVKVLDAARQDLSQQLDATKRQLSETQGDLKLLSQQLGSISERFDGFSASRASARNGADPSQAKRTK